MRSLQHRRREAVLKWSEDLITFDREDHPDHVPQPGSYPLVVAPLFKSKRVHKVLMDGGRGINMLYASTLDDMGTPRSALRLSTAPFHAVVPGMEALPIRQINLPITFGDVQNFRMETLTFEVVGFSGTYHAILGRPAYPKFMAVQNYTYMKQQIPGLKGIITVGPMYQQFNTHTSATLSAFSLLKQSSVREASHRASIRGPGFPRVVQASGLLF
jgi:hypothetical protein